MKFILLCALMLVQALDAKREFVQARPENAQSIAYRVKNVVQDQRCLVKDWVKLAEANDWSNNDIIVKFRAYAKKQKKACPPSKRNATLWKFCDQVCSHAQKSICAKGCGEFCAAVINEKYQFDLKKNDMTTSLLGIYSCVEDDGSNKKLLNPDAKRTINRHSNLEGAAAKNKKLKKSTATARKNLEEGTKKGTLAMVSFCEGVMEFSRAKSLCNTKVCKNGLDKLREARIAASDQRGSVVWGDDLYGKGPLLTEKHVKACQELASKLGPSAFSSASWAKLYSDVVEDEVESENQKDYSDDFDYDMPPDQNNDFDDVEDEYDEEGGNE